MIAELGLVLLIITIMLSSVLFFIPFLKFRSTNLIFDNHTISKVCNLMFGSIFVSFLCLTYSFIISDFSLKVVSENSNSQLPLIYKITGVWGNHEGSILLWLLVMVFFGFLFSRSNIKDFSLKKKIICIQGGLCFLIGLFIFFTSSPFERILPPEIEGKDLNPLLQDPGLAIHPPLLYLGYVGFSIVYSIAVGGLLNKKIDKDFIMLLKPWVYVSWIFLTFGIGLGSWWAYYELGWGGFWFWDPVENASLLPWLTGTALLHSIIVSEKKGTLIAWTLLLSIITFSLSLIGTFLVRSGVLVSVHAFANDPSRGIFILGLLIFVIGFGLVCFIKNYKYFIKQTDFISPLSREGAISLNNIFMLTIAGTVFFGTIYPLIADAIFNKKISVGAPFFNAVIIPFTIPLVLGMMLGPFLKWGKDDIFKISHRLKYLFVSIFIMSIIFWYIESKSPVLAIIFVTLSIWLFMSSIFEIIEQFKIKKKVNKNWWRIPTKIYAQTFSHIGFSLLIIGATGTSILKKESIQFQNIGDQVKIDKYLVRFNGVEHKNKQNYKTDFASFEVFVGNKLITILNPEKRFYNSGNQVTTEAAIYSNFLGDLYIAIGDQNKTETKSWTTRIWFNPYTIWIWIGILMMGLGAMISLIFKKK